MFSADQFPVFGLRKAKVRHLVGPIFEDRGAKGRFVLLPASEQTHGHGTHTWAAVWQQYLAQLLEQSKTPENSK